MPQRGKEERCQVDHSSMFVHYKREVVHNVPMIHEKNYLREMWGSINTYLREHRSSFHGCPSGNLSVQCNTCSCSPIVCDSDVLGKGREKLDRDVLEDFFMNERSRAADVCVLRCAPPTTRKWHCCIAYTEKFLHIFPKRNVTLSSTFFL